MIWVKPGVTGVNVTDVDIDGLGTAGQRQLDGCDRSRQRHPRQHPRRRERHHPRLEHRSRDNYIHDLGAPGSPHYDGFQLDGGLSNIRIEHNTVDMREHGQTAAVMIDNYFGPISNVVVTATCSRAVATPSTPTASSTAAPSPGVSFTNNRLISGYWGYASIVRNTPTWSGNTDHRTGSVVNR